MSSGLASSHPVMGPLWVRGVGVLAREVCNCRPSVMAALAPLAPEVRVLGRTPSWGNGDGVGAAFLGYHPGDSEFQAQAHTQHQHSLRDLGHPCHLSAPWCSPLSMGTAQLR